MRHERELGGNTGESAGSVVQAPRRINSLEDAGLLALNIGKRLELRIITPEQADAELQELVDGYSNRESNRGVTSGR